MVESLFFMVTPPYQRLNSYHPLRFRELREKLMFLPQWPVELLRPRLKYDPGLQPDLYLVPKA